MEGDISPGERMGTLEGELCSTEAIGVLEGMLRRSPNGRGTKTKVLGLPDELKRRTTRCAGGDGGLGDRDVGGLDRDSLTLT
jgi:hypothetical protein